MIARAWKRRNPIVLAIALTMLVIVGISDASFWTYSLAMVGVYAIVGIGFNISFGSAGQVTFAAPAFMALGAYVNGILGARSHVNPWLALLAALVAGAALGAVVYLPFLRLRGHYLAMGTLALTLGVNAFAANASAITGGAIGIPNLPFLAIGSFSFDTDQRFFVLVWVAVALCLAVFYLLTRSHIGRAWRALAARPDVSSSLGIEVPRARLLALVVGATMAALSGALLSDLLGYVAPDYFNVVMVGNVFFVVIVGGAGQLAAPLIGAAVVVLLPQEATFLGSWQNIAILGLLLLWLIIWPTGVLGESSGRAGVRALLPRRPGIPMRLPTGPPQEDPA
jgi:branched-chain amino acid transport system permease protein